MKKFLFNFIILLSSFLIIQDVNASSFKASIVGNATFDSEITLYIQVNDLTDFAGACNGLCGLVGNLSYDTNKLELKEITALENFDLTEGKTLVLYKSTGVKSGTKILAMKFKNKSLTPNETTTISFSNIVASDGDKDINTSDASKTIKFAQKETQTTNNNSTTTQNNNSATSQKPSSKTTTKKVTTKKSSNNYLSSITLSAGNITFKKDVLTYDIDVDYEISSIEIKATTANTKATISGLGKHSLNIGDNVIKLIIKAEDKSERTYTLNIKRASKDVVQNKENDQKDLKEEKEKNYILPSIIILVVLSLIIGGVIIYKKKKNN